MLALQVRMYTPTSQGKNKYTVSLKWIFVAYISVQIQ